MTAVTSGAAGALRGTLRVPGDKSISHRALMLAASTVGETAVHGLLEADDVLATAAAMEALGAAIERGGDGGPWRIRGRGVGGLAEPVNVLDLGNSGTAARLLTGLLAGQPFNSTLTGDASLTGRPMARVTGPLERMGGRFTCRSGGRLPMTVHGTDRLRPIVETPDVASAQVKSAILLAGLTAPGKTTVIERRRSRDHTERMLRSFGADVAIEETADGTAATVTGQPELEPAEIRVPGDISSAAFPLVAASVIEGSDISVPAVGTNPLRAGLLTCLEEMGAKLTRRPVDDGAGGGEPIADLRMESAPLTGIDVPPERAPSMIDEYPILAMAAACAAGPTAFHGVGELRVKESDRLSALAAGLAACGVEVEETEDSLAIHGRGEPPAGGATIAAGLDHRIAMAFLVLGQVTGQPVTIDDGSTIATSFPGFTRAMGDLGAVFSAEGPGP